ncbi:GTP pyrophosphokinase YwaC [Burkholderia pseudomultivorans]|uniref:GTP pyrophosphokinase YwaC n=1 Tax=Burkholderia pseudomultivorans TaxID=1207504 RepID=A0A6P2JP28_9BURK|nr:GTP pyrophosphokinase family protein [Burkholderia pseudomultivorans]VWB45936.1 GTP pyrophosphokinase YwaC [Burkholderia pseudomultivorans]
MEKDVSTKMLDAYDKNNGLYSDFCGSVERLLRDLLSEKRIEILSVTSRVKGKGSLERKIATKGVGRYKSLADVTDVCGVRVITYFEGDVSRVADLIRAEFDIDEKNSTDKYHASDPDRFGYRSVHFVVTHRASRRCLSEYRRYESCKAEIQIRSILQHAWAEIEHDLGYKASEDVPAPVRRRFSRLSGLLELADEEFMTIRKEIDAYEQALASRMSKDLSDVAIDAASYVAFVNGDSLVKSIDDAIVGPSSGVVIPSPKSRTDRNVSQLRFLGIDRVGQLKQLLQEHEEKIVKFAHRFVTRDGRELSQVVWPAKGVASGISIYYLGLVLLTMSGQEGRLKEYLAEFFPGNANMEADLKATAADLAEKRNM